MPKKKGAASQKGFADASARFLARVYDAVVAHVDFAVVRCLLLAGPGCTKDDFRAYLLATAAQRCDASITRAKAAIVAAHASTAYLQAIPVRASAGALPSATCPRLSRRPRHLRWQI